MNRSFVSFAGAWNKDSLEKCDPSYSCVMVKPRKRKLRSSKSKIYEWWIIVLPNDDLVRRLFKTRREAKKWLALEPSGKLVKIFLSIIQ